MELWVKRNWEPKSNDYKRRSSSSKSKWEKSIKIWKPNWTSKKRLNFKIKSKSTRKSLKNSRRLMSKTRSSSKIIIKRKLLNSRKIWLQQDKVLTLKDKFWKRRELICKLITKRKSVKWTRDSKAKLQLWNKTIPRRYQTWNHPTRSSLKKKPQLSEKKRKP